MKSANTSIEQAIEFYHLGNFTEANRICREILKKNYREPIALHILGSMLSESGLHDQAIRVLEQALVEGVQGATILHTYGIALQRNGMLGKAAETFRHVIKMEPLRVDSWYSLGEVELLSNNCANAAEAFEKVLEKNPSDIEARNNLSIALKRIGRLSDARMYLQQIVNTNPKNVGAQNNLGIVETELKNFTAAKVAFQTALSISPAYADACYNLGNVYLHEMNYQVAAECYDQTLALDHSHEHAIYHLLLCRQKQNLYAEALSIANDMVADSGDDVSNNVLALGSRANILRDLGQYDSALDDIKAAQVLSPKDFKLMGNKALTLQHAGFLEESISTYKAALKIYPANEQLRSNLAQALLLAGYYKEGWQEFEARLDDVLINEKQSSLPGATWQSENLTGKRLLLWCEQGLGDTIQFIRYVTFVAAEAKSVTLVCPKRLKQLLLSYKGNCKIISDTEVLPEVDFKAPLMSLPHLLALQKIPNTRHYLSADPDLITRWAKVLGKRKKPRIGIAWQGNPDYEGDYQRSIALSWFEPLMAKQNYDFFSLQQGFGQEQLARFSKNLIELKHDIDNESAFVDTAAIMANLDLIITSDTAIPHLASALGLPVWLLLPKVPDWRWMLKKKDSPWYPKMRLFRQTRAGEWETLFSDVIRALDQEVFEL
jgi:tetratricopeptide (TPR) repeat protein